MRVIRRERDEVIDKRGERLGVREDGGTSQRLPGVPSAIRPRYAGMTQDTRLEPGSAQHIEAAHKRLVGLVLVDL